MKVLLSSFRL